MSGSNFNFWETDSNSDQILYIPEANRGRLFSGDPRYFPNKPLQFSEQTIYNQPCHEGL